KGVADVTLTGGFDLTLQISDGALTRAGARLHAQQLLSHRSLRTRGGELFDIVFGPPMIAAAAPHVDGRARVTARTRLLVRARAVDDPSSAGRAAIAETVFRVRLDPTAASWAQIDIDDRLRVDWSESTAGDITLVRADAGFEGDVRAAILEMTA